MTLSSAFLSTTLLKHCTLGGNFHSYKLEEVPALVEEILYSNQNARKETTVKKSIPNEGLYRSSSHKK